MTTGDDPTLSGAYEIETPEDNRRFYGAWAADYDRDLREKYRYVYPQRIAALLESLGASGPVLDVGCGTGLVGEALKPGPVDGVDISPEMLSAARAKGVYRDLFEADLTATLPMPDGAYTALISAGTFTEGHVGPEALPELVRVAAGGAVFALGVNEMVFEKLKFPQALAALAAAGKITAPEYRTGAVFAEDADHEKAGNSFTAAIFRRI